MRLCFAQDAWPVFTKCYCPTNIYRTLKIPCQICQEQEKRQWLCYLSENEKQYFKDVFKITSE